MERDLLLRRGPMRRPMHGRRGFTLLELATVVAIASVLATLAFSYLPRFVRRAGVRSSAFDLIATLQQAKSHAAQSGRDTVVVILGSAGNPASCTHGTGNPDCVRWWMLEDVVAAAGAPECPGATACGPFGAAQLAAFDPANPAGGGPGQGGDLLVDSGALDRYVTLGRPATAPASLSPPLAGVDVSGACTFCTATAPLRGFVKFNNDGTATMSGNAALAGGAIFLQGEAATEEWRGIAVTVPAGIISSRLWVMR